MLPHLFLYYGADDTDEGPTLAIFGGQNDTTIASDALIMLRLPANQTGTFTAPKYPVQNTIATGRCDHVCAAFPERQSMAIFSGSSALLLPPNLWEYNSIAQTWFTTSSDSSFPASLIASSYVHLHSFHQGLVFGGNVPASHMYI